MSVKEIISRYQDELEQWHPDAQRSDLCETLPEELNNMAGLEEMRQVLKRKKFMYLAIEAQLNFLNGCTYSDLASLENAMHGQDLEVARLEGKERNTTLKRLISLEEEKQIALYEELSAVYQDAMKCHKQCELELSELADVVNEADIANNSGNSPQLELINSIENLKDARVEMGCDAERTANIWCGQSEENIKRRRFEYEQKYLEQQLHQPQEMRNELEHCEAQEQSRVEFLESMARIEDQLGLPRIEFDDENGVIVVGQPIANNPNDLAMRTVKIERDAQGRLIRAEPHPSLGLWNEGTVSVENDDIARLLTLVWDRLCEQQGDVCKTVEHARFNGT